MPFLLFAYLIAYVDRINLGIAGLQMTRELGFSDAVFGFGSGIFFVGYLLLGIPGALLVEKWSARKVMAITMVAWGCVAAATGLIRSKPDFYAMRFLLGLTQAAFFPGVITYLGHWFPLRYRAKAIATFMIAIPVSQVVAAPISAALLRVGWLGLSGWRWLLILEGLPAILFGLMTVRYLTDRPRQAEWLTPDARDWLTQELEHEASAKAGGPKLSPWAAVRHPYVILLCLAYFGGTTGNYGLSLWMPKILSRIGGLGAVKTSLLTAIPPLAAVPAMLLIGWHSDRKNERRLHAATPRLCAGAALLALTYPGIGLPLALLLFALAFSGVDGAYGPLWTLPTTFLGTTAAAASIGLINVFGNLGGFAGPYAIGWLSQQTGAYAAGLGSVAAALFMSGFCILLVRRRALQS